MVANQKIMSTNARFAVALHILAYVAMRGQSSQSITSEMIAESVNTNPVVIRRILGTLRQAHLVNSQPGTGGGWTLAQSANTITLLQIYQAVKEVPLLAVHRHPPNAQCPIGQNMINVLNVYFAQAENAIEKQLEGVTFDQITRAIQAHAPARPLSNRQVIKRVGTRR